MSNVIIADRDILKKMLSYERSNIYSLDSNIYSVAGSKKRSDHMTDEEWSILHAEIKEFSRCYKRWLFNRMKEVDSLKAATPDIVDRLSTIYWAFKYLLVDRTEIFERLGVASTAVGYKIDDMNTKFKTRSEELSLGVTRGIGITTVKPNIYEINLPTTPNKNALINPDTINKEYPADVRFQTRKESLRIAKTEGDKFKQTIVLKYLDQMRKIERCFEQTYEIMNEVTQNNIYPTLYVRDNIYVDIYNKIGKLISAQYDIVMTSIWINDINNLIDAYSTIRLIILGMLADKDTAIPLIKAYSRQIHFNMDVVSTCIGAMISYNQLKL